MDMARFPFRYDSVSQSAVQTSIQEFRRDRTADWSKGLKEIDPLLPPVRLAERRKVAAVIESRAEQASQRKSNDGREENAILGAS